MAHTIRNTNVSRMVKTDKQLRRLKRREVKRQIKQIIRQMAALGQEVASA